MGSVKHGEKSSTKSVSRASTPIVRGNSVEPFQIPTVNNLINSLKKSVPEVGAVQDSAGGQYWFVRKQDRNDFNKKKTDGQVFGVINGFEAKVHPGKQGKHIQGHSNYKKGKSIFNGDAQKLLDEKAGTGQWLGANKERVDFGQVIGKYVDPITGEYYETTKGIIHYSKNGAHIVPSNPISW